MGQIIVTPPSRALIVTGFRGQKVSVGGCALVLPVVEQAEFLELTLFTVEVVNEDTETATGVPVTVRGVCQLKLNLFRDGEFAVDEAKVKVASQHFLGFSIAEIEETIKDSLEGHQRSIIGALTVEQLFQDRETFTRNVRQNMIDDISAMGLVLVSYVVQSVSDSHGYMDALGETQFALVHREAQEGTEMHSSMAKRAVAEFESSAQIEVANVQRAAHVSISESNQKRSESDRNLDLLRSKFSTEVGSARAEAEAAYDITLATLGREEVREKTQQQVVAAELQVQIAENNSQQRQIQIRGTSQANLTREKNNAEGVRVATVATADRLRVIGAAQAAATGAMGNAEAAVLASKAQAFKQYGDAAVVDTIVQKLPELAAIVVQPVVQTDKMVFVTNDGTAGSKVTGDVVKMLRQVPDAIEQMTGVNFKNKVDALANTRARQAV